MSNSKKDILIVLVVFSLTVLGLLFSSCEKEGMRELPCSRKVEQPNGAYIEYDCE